MNRRDFVTGPGALLAVPLVVEAQQSRVYRVGVVDEGGPYSDFVSGLRDGLKDWGFEEGKQFVFALHDTKGDLKSVETAARTLEAERVDVMCAVATSVALAATRATQRVPIVFYAGTNPVAVGLVKSFRSDDSPASTVSLRTSHRSGWSY